MESEDIIMNTNISYKIISQNQKVENDKERIKSKFNFNISRTSTNSSVYKQSSLPTNKNTIKKNNKRYKMREKFLPLNEKVTNIRIFRNKSNINIKNSKNSHVHENSNKNSKISKSKELKKNKKNKNYKSNNIDNNNINHSLSNISNINNTYLNENSLAISDYQKWLQDRILKTQLIIDGRNNNNSSNNNYIDLDNKVDNFLKIENENEDETEKGKFESFNKSSFSGESKTSEIHDVLNLRNNNSSAEDYIQIANNEKYVIKNFIGVNNNNNKNNDTEENEKQNFEIAENIQLMFSPFNNESSERKRTEVNEMGLLDDDEYNQENRKKMLANVSKYYFIEDIIKKNNDFISLSFEKFKKINNKAKYRIFAFVYDNFQNFLNSSIYMRRIINEMLEEKFNPCLKDFENKYKNILSIENYQFNIHEFVKQKLKKKKFQTFCLYIKAKVLPNNEYFVKFGDICFELSYKYKIRCIKDEYNTKSNRTYISTQSYISKDHIQEEYMQIYKFDLRKDKIYPMWICSERDEIFNKASRNFGFNSIISKTVIDDELYQKHLIYSTPIININENDFIVFRIDLIENNNIIENISFNEPIVQSVNKKYFHKISFKQNQKFDKMRDCENELAINTWHDDYVINNYNKKKINYEEFLIILKKTFKEYFEIIETKFDISKFVFIRMTMKAKKIGILKSNIFSNKDIEIVDKNTSLTKECTPINFVNTFSMSKSLVIRQGTIIDFYLME